MYLLGGLFVLILSASTWAQHSPYALTPEQQFQLDMQDCAKLGPMADADACRTEARNVLTETRKGLLQSRTNEPLRHNATERCDVFVGQDLQDCLARLQMPNREEGSVEEGGVLRERIVTVPGR